MQTLNTLLPCAFAALAVAHSISVCQPSLVTDREVVSAYLSVGSRPEGDFTGRIGGLPISLSVDAEQHVQVTQSGIPLFAARLDPAIKDIALADLDDDGTDELLLAVGVGSERGGVMVYSWDSGTSEYRQLTGLSAADYFPFLIQTGDIDGDGGCEVILGLWAPSMGDTRKYARKLHIYDFKANELIPEWFSERTFTDFRIVRLGDANRILETRESNNRWIVSVFSWHHFGFWLDERLFVTDRAVHLDHLNDRALLRNDSGRVVEVVSVNNRFEVIPHHERNGDERN
jgi:hypothetical protein